MEHKRQENVNSHSRGAREVNHAETSMWQVTESAPLCPPPGGVWESGYSKRAFPYTCNTPHTTEVENIYINYSFKW